MTDVATTHAEGCWEWGPKHYSCAAREIERLRARVSEADELRARAEASVASMSAEMTAARELIGVQWWLLEHPLCGSRSFMDGLRRAFEARERDARLGAAVRAEVSNTNTYGYVPALDLAVRAAGARAHGNYAIGYLLSAIADVLRAEEGGSDAG